MPDSPPLLTSNDDGPDLTMTVNGTMTGQDCFVLARGLTDHLKQGTRSVRMDLSRVREVDDFGVVTLLDMHRKCLAAGITFSLAAVPDSISDFLDLAGYDTLLTTPRSAPHAVPGLITRLGDKTIKTLDNLRGLLIFIGDIVLGLLLILARPGNLRRGDTVTVMQRVGVDALPIVGLLSFLLGLIMAFMSAVQLKQFGANIYVASLVALSMVRELGPIMTAIIVAGRSGSAFAAEIGSMRISEEVDALTTMGFDTTLFLTMPRILGTLAVVPLLNLFSDLFAIAGGMLIGVTTLDLTVQGYMNQTLWTLTLFDLFWGLGKSAVFALIIAGIGCFRGFKVRGGADAVGRATTSSVVSSIFMIIVVDSIFAVILRYWG
ncbi:MAG TPA: MlaE family lipid ABC transporter permease subunit [Desulfomicrobiaceae bacterium]|nr:MlaE family lipid ABC transporter permease subunit [Desulfomicrobiaceae bacterium]